MNKEEAKQYQKQYQKQYRENHKEEIKQYKKENYKNNKEKILNQQKEYYENNKEEIKQRNKNYYSNHKEQCKNMNNKRFVKKYHSDPEFKFYRNMKTNIYKFLNKINKSERTKEILGYSFEDFKKYMINNNRIQEGYLFEDYQNGKLTIDHIIPQILFPKTIEGVKLANQLKNLRLITMNDNIKKNDNINLQLIENFDLLNLYNIL
jgi:hypothetical protein